MPLRLRPKRPGDNASTDTPSNSKRLKAPGTLRGVGDSDGAAGGNVTEFTDSSKPESRRGASGPASPALAHAAASWPPSVVSSKSSKAISPDVRIRVNVMNLLDIDIPRHRFEIKFFLEASWEVPDSEVEFILHYADEDSTGRPLMLRDSDNIVRAGSTTPQDVPMLRRHTSSGAVSNGSDLPKESSSFCSRDFEGDNDTSAPFDGSQFPFTSHTANCADSERPAKLRWTPRLSFANQLELDKQEDFFETYKYNRNSSVKMPRPVVVYRLRGTGVFQERFELHAFPFDAQDLQICITSKHLSLRLHMNDTVKYKPVIPYRHFFLQDEYVTLV